MLVRRHGYRKRQLNYINLLYISIIKLAKGKKQAQAAMEFLLTYGWAIMIVIVAVSALAYFGIVTPSGMASYLKPDRCDMPVEIYCADHVLKTDISGEASSDQTHLQLYLANNRGFKVSISEVCIIGTTYCKPFSSGDEESILENNKPKLFIVTGIADPIPVGTKYDYELSISYINEDTELEHTAKGRITGTVQKN